ncbi:MAG: AAA family ATPase [Holophagales bacterium]|nr:AAA family ATPase [Holophagales bacterium]MYF96391.1 AAA family ATPase [Holophagales bacterium]
MPPGRKIILIAGPNGGGKPTFALEYLPYEPACPIFVNADLIAAGVSPLAPDAAAFRAGRLMLGEIDRHARQRRSFAFETTLAGLGYLRRIRRWRSRGYAVRLVYLPLASPEEALRRVEQRVRQGGHRIPEDVVRRRFQRSVANFRHVYRDLVDSWVVVDRRGRRLVVVEEGANQ